jgi:hypothetical protein
MTAVNTPAAVIARTATSGDVAVIAALVAAELANPDGSAVLVTTVAVGDLSDQSARDELRRGCEALADAAPPRG